MVEERSEVATITRSLFMSIVTACLGVKREVIMTWNSVLAGIVRVLSLKPTLVFTTVELLET